MAPRYYGVIDRQGRTLYVAFEFFPAKAAMLRLKHLHPALHQSDTLSGPWNRICARCGREVPHFRSICTGCSKDGN